MRIAVMRIGVLGRDGRMGQLLAEEVVAAGHALVNETSVDAGVLAATSDAVIDFTHASRVRAHAAVLGEAGVPWILGTTGLDAGEEAAVAEAAVRATVVCAPNFSPGVTLLLALAEKMASALPGDVYDAEIVEMHHRQKVDAPSGTAIGLGRAVAAGRGVRLEDVMVGGRQGHTGPRPPGAIGFAAMRGGQVVGEHTLLFAAGSEHIALSHQALDRRVFATGAVQAAGWAYRRAPGLYSMMDVLGIKP